MLQRIRQQLDAGRMPTDELIDGALVFAGGLLLLLPGFVSDAVGLHRAVPADARTSCARSYAGACAS